MHRIDHSTATVDNLFTEGVPSSGTPATVVTDDWLNDVQENIANFIEDQGITLLKGDYNQLSQAIALSSYARHFYTLNGGATWSSPTLTLTSDLEIIFRNEAGARRINKLPAAAYTIADGSVLVFRLDNSSASPVTLTVETVYANLDVGQYMILPESSLTLDYIQDEVIVLRNRGGDLECALLGMHFYNGDTIGFGKIVPKVSPTFTGTMTAANANFSGNVSVATSQKMSYNSGGTTYTTESTLNTNLDTYVNSALLARLNSSYLQLNTGLQVSNSKSILVDSGNVNITNGDFIASNGSIRVNSSSVISLNSGLTTYFKEATLNTNIETFINSTMASSLKSNGELLLGDVSTPSAGYLSRRSGVSARLDFTVTGASTANLNDSYNVSSISVSSYDVTINWDTNFSDGNYSIATGAKGGTTPHVFGFGSVAAGSCVMYCMDSSGSQFTGGWYGSVIATGDQ